MEAPLSHALPSGIGRRRVRLPVAALLEWLCLFGFVLAIGGFAGSLGGLAVAAAKHRGALEVRLVLLAGLAVGLAVALQVSVATIDLVRSRRAARRNAADAVPATIFVGTMAGVFAATESGWAWVAAGTGLPDDATIHSVAVDAGDGMTIYARTDRGRFRSTDRGSTWHAWFDSDGRSGDAWVRVDASRRARSSGRP